MCIVVKTKYESFYFLNSSFYKYFFYYSYKYLLTIRRFKIYYEKSMCPCEAVVKIKVIFLKFLLFFVIKINSLQNQTQLLALITAVQ